MRVISVISDELLQANNALLEMTISEYLDIGLKILKNNQYQRKRVSRSSSIYSLLNQDMKKLCSIPTIVLAFTDESNIVDLQEGMESATLVNNLQNSNLIILDGLQRTYTMRDVLMDLLYPEDEKQRFRNHKIRVEVYCGLTKTGILYRMLTLNTGQTPMSKRHEIEILYSSYLENEIDGIHFNRQVDPKAQTGIDVYNFDDAIDGFNSFLDSDEAAMDRLQLLSVVQRLEKIANDDYSRDLFKQFIKLYNSFVHQMDDKMAHWTLSDDQKKQLKSIYGKDIPSVFNKAQTLSAFGAAIGNILWTEADRGFGNMEQRIADVNIQGEPDAVMFKLLDTLQIVRESAKKIGVAQRLYLKLFFMCLLDSTSESYLNFNKSIDLSKKLYDGKTIQP